MKYKMYLLHIGDFEDQSLQETALALIDDYRQESVRKMKREKDRMRAIAAGLLLQAGFAELDVGTPYGEIPKTDTNPGTDGIFPERDTNPGSDGVSGICYKLSGKELVQHVQGRDKIPLVYEIGEYGKPNWNRQRLQHLFPEKKLWHFNLSHSGEYVVLLAADCEVGVDIQKARKVDRFPGGFRKFSHMEAYVKCTGAGYAAGYKIYEQYHGAVPGYRILSLQGIAEYAWHMCFADFNIIENIGVQNDSE